MNPVLAATALNVVVAYSSEADGEHSKHVLSLRNGYCGPFHEKTGVSCSVMHKACIL